ncbi:MAG: DNA/RNA nuclease SfsA [Gemmatimonadetes bacterium]|uniref:Sugar fermentation stimulation protein homolog n=1 Tax=Candidatus Kutchimonas denitrificans TaxID=3056748 RepID=A0AAE5CCF6_9BACT|nr:DNA/RNA nuclease SfsA [Gemmatimonadota bacterium]NIR74114.1 DNA/RNA nuclease SfsA [Candidatus Kutchimonas denitrificans]NIS01296.1 DNA/RNA nuclease SfsA [Gemmatimonadota bacterium]NIT67027.1 DNA/RNA nuclease SfsA [Gemmatimonadota bacterium]NIU51687.1 DNA/RNA nuclease SfsA [Gemmatimonadota bacterium]
MKLPGPLHPATFLSRPNRFLTEVELDGRVVEAHLPDPGRLRELLVPGARVWVRPEAGPNRKTGFTLTLVEKDGEKVSVVTTLPNQLTAEALEAGRIQELVDWEVAAREHSWGRSRFDFLLARGDERMLLEVKSVTLLDRRRALFPDAVTARGARHVTELAAARAAGYDAAVLFVVQRRDAESVTAARAIDPAFADALIAARGSGVRMLGYRCRVTLDEAAITGPIPVAID